MLIRKQVLVLKSKNMKTTVDTGRRVVYKAVITSETTAICYAHVNTVLCGHDWHTARLHCPVLHASICGTQLRDITGHR